MAMEGRVRRVAMVGIARKWRALLPREIGFGSQVSVLQTRILVDLCDRARGGVEVVCEEGEYSQ
jgi:hypothetical protein